MLASTNSARRVVYHIVRTISSTGCKHSPELKVGSPDNGNTRTTDPASSIRRFGGGRVTSSDTISQATEVFPKSWPVWDSKSERVTFLNMDCSAMETDASLDMFEVKVKCDVEQMNPECVYIQQVNRDVYTTRLIPLMSRLGYDSHNFLGDHVGQASFYKNQTSESK